MSGTKLRWQVRCFGAVQQVGFRYTAAVLAKKLSLTGWVVNLDDGSVLLEAQGDAAQLRQFYLRLKSQPHIHITKLQIDVIPAETGERNFRVRMTYG